MCHLWLVDHARRVLLLRQSERRGEGKEKGQEVSLEEEWRSAAGGHDGEEEVKGEEIEQH